MRSNLALCLTHHSVESVEQLPTLLSSMCRHLVTYGETMPFARLMLSCVTVKSITQGHCPLLLHAQGDAHKQGM